MDLASSPEPMSDPMHDFHTHWLVVSDLDGTLLDDGCDLSAAARALDRQAGLGRSVALASGGTLAQMLGLARLCQVAPVLVFEGGAGIAWPDPAAGASPLRYRADCVGPGYASLRHRLRALRRRGGFRFVGFGDLSASEVAACAGLSRDAARLARQRRCTEPVLWLDTAGRLAEFRAALAAAGCVLLERDGLLHVTPRVDKAHALRRVAGALVAARRARVRVIACGDGDEDLDMLRAADRALVFPRRDGSHLEVCNAAGDEVGIRVSSAGPASWSRALDRIASPARYAALAAVAS